jgi:DNA gyrase/topoisomerase IV subunit A
MGFFCKPDLGETTRNGRRFARLKEGDEVACFAPAEGSLVTAATRSGKVLTFPSHELPELSRAGRGVILMRVDPTDRLVGALAHRMDAKLAARGEDGTERRFAPPAPGHRAQAGRKILKRMAVSGLCVAEAATTLF